MTEGERSQCQQRKNRKFGSEERGNGVKCCREGGKMKAQKHPLHVVTDKSQDSRRGHAPVERPASSRIRLIKV